MVIRAAIALLCLFIISFGLYFLPGGFELGDIVPQDAGGILVINHPVDLAIKAADSDIAKDLRQIEPLKPVFKLLDQLYLQKAKLGIATLISPTIYVVVPQDLVRRVGQRMPFTTYIHLGRLSKVLKLFGIERVASKKMRAIRFHGQTMFVEDDHAWALLNGFLVFGEEEGVMNAILCSEGDMTPLNTNSKIIAKAKSTFSSDADISFYLLAKEFFERGGASHKWDPRILIDANAFSIAGGNFYFESDRITADMTIYHKEGKLFLPYTLDNNSIYGLRKFMSDDLFLAAGVKLEKPSQLSENFIGLFQGESTRSSALVAKLTRLSMNYFLENIGPEVGVFIPNFQDGAPAIVMQVKDSDKTSKSLEKLSQENGSRKELAKLLDVPEEVVKNNPEKITELVENLEEEEIRKSAALLLEQVERSSGQSGVIVVAKKEVNYYLAKDYIIFSGHDWVIDKLLETYRTSPSKLMIDAMENAGANGSAFMVVNLLEAAMGGDLIKSEKVLRIFQRYDWNLAISIKGGGSKTVLHSHLGLELGTRSAFAEPTTFAYVIFYGLIGFGILLCIGALVLLIFLVRSTYKEYKNDILWKIDKMRDQKKANTK